jgi:hypothetical protein
MFVYFNGKAFNADTIESITFKNLAKWGFVNVYFKGGAMEPVEGPEAFNLIMELCPQALEGQNAKYNRHAWAVHNLIGHPLMQVLSWLHLTKLGLKIHDMTVPNPITK